MSSPLQKWLRRAAAAVISLLVLVGVFVAAILGTEVGTHWAIQRVVGITPGKLEVPDIRGTLLGTLSIPVLSYSNDGMRISAAELEINIDWSRLSRDQIHLQWLHAGEIRYEGLEERDPTPKPLEISMPALPILLGSKDIVVGALYVDELLFENIRSTNLVVDGNRFVATQAAAEVEQLGVAVNNFSIKLEGDVPTSGQLAWRILDGSWSGKAELDGTMAELVLDHELDGEYPATTSGKVFLLNKIEPEVDVVVRFARWQFASVIVSNGEVHVLGSASAYQTGFETEIESAEKLSAHLRGRATGDRNGLETLTVDATGPAGEISAAGTLLWLPELATDLTIHAQNVDPSMVAAIASGKLDADLHLVASSVDDFVVNVLSLDGSYNDAPASATGRISRKGGSWNCVSCDFTLGPNHVVAGGLFSDGKIAADYSINAPALRMLWPGLRGSLVANGSVRGTTSLPIFSGTFEGSELTWGEWSVASVSLSSGASSTARVDFSLSVDQLQRTGEPLGGGKLRAVGELVALDSELEWSLGEYRVVASALIAIEGDDVSGAIRSASIDEPMSGTWVLRRPLGFSAIGADFRIGEHEWANGDAQVVIAGLSQSGGIVQAEATLRDMPLATLNVTLPESIRLEGYADADLAAQQQADGWLGNIHWRQRQTVLHFEPPGDEKIEISVPGVDANIRLTGSGVEGRVAVEVDPGVTGALDFALAGLLPNSQMTARLLLNGSEWGWIPAFFPEIDNFSGVIAADISGAGSLAAPELQGEMRWHSGKLDIPAINVPLTDIDVTITGSSSGSADLTGTALAGKGPVRIEGRFADLMQSSRSFTARLQGEKVTLLNWTEHQVIATPDLNVSGSADGISVTGSVNVDRAEIAVNELPEGSVAPSADVVVSGREQEPAAEVPVRADVQLMLSDKVHVKAFGLDTNVEGQLRFRLSAGRPPRANGELKLINGEFRAYGQQLQIEHGTMTFSGPIDDPTINVRAIREIETVNGVVKAGIDLRGRAQSLTSSVFSVPAMSDADALSYLIFGRPLQEASATEGNALSNTAYSLGLRQATAITNQIGRTFGLDELAVTGSNQSTTSLVAGKQLNSRLYVRYAYTAFTQLGNLLLRYKLNKNLTIEAGTGESEMMDLLYIVEKP